MPYTLYTRSYGSSSAGYKVQIVDSNIGVPARILSSAAGGLISEDGRTSLDSSGNLNVYLDTSRTWSVNVIDEDVKPIDSAFLTTTEASQVRALVTGSGVSGVTYDGSSRIIGYVVNGIVHTITYPTSTSAVISNTLGATRNVTFDSSGRVTSII